MAMEGSRPLGHADPPAKVDPPYIAGISTIVCESVSDLNETSGSEESPGTPAAIHLHQRGVGFAAGEHRRRGSPARVFILRAFT